MKRVFQIADKVWKRAPCKSGLSFGPGRLLRSTGLGHVCGLVVEAIKQVLKGKVVGVPVCDLYEKGSILV